MTAPPLPSDSPPADVLPRAHPDAVRLLLDRPLEQRTREYQYRFAQSAVFGFPVILLEVFGRSLGGPESDRWVAVLQAALTGWIVYVGAAGMVFESLIQFARRRMIADALPSIAATCLYLMGAARLAGHLVRAGISSGSDGQFIAHRPFPPMPFHWVVLLLVAWTGYRWWRMRGTRAASNAVGDGMNAAGAPATSTRETQ